MMPLQETRKNGMDENITRCSQLHSKTRTEVFAPKYETSNGIMTYKKWLNRTKKIPDLWGYQMILSVADPGISEFRGKVEFFGSEKYFDASSHTLCFYSKSRELQKWDNSL